MQTTPTVRTALYSLHSLQIKYGSKIFIEPDVNEKPATGDAKIYAAGLYNIFDAMKGLRIFERFCFNLPPGSKKAPVGQR